MTRRPYPPKPPNYKIIVRLDLKERIPYAQMAKRIEELLALSFAAKGVKVLTVTQTAFRVTMQGGTS